MDIFLIVLSEELNTEINKLQQVSNMIE